jgi:hypothetical protein
MELDDPRRWRDDGKRDERMAVRRDRYNDRDYRDRDRIVRDRERTGDTWEPSDRSNRRWAAEDRDARSKQSSGRERRGANGDEARERDDRKEREREREKEKEPAWMDTYIPSGSSGGILGGKGSDGELDGIQAWKKNMKEKEQKDKGSTGDGVGKSLSTPESKDGTAPSALSQTDKPLDEIQLFKLMMKREEEKRKSGPSNEPLSEVAKSNDLATLEMKSSSPSGERSISLIRSTGIKLMSARRSSFPQPLRCRHALSIGDKHPKADLSSIVSHSDRCRRGHVR